MMTCTEIKEFIKDSASQLFKCDLLNDLLVITTPFSYPDGDDIELFIEFKRDHLILSDMGETLRYLDTYLLDTTATEKRRTIVQDVINSTNLRLSRGNIYAVIRNPDRLLEAMFNMSQAIIRISDLLYTTKIHTVAVFEEEVKSFLEDNHFSFEQDYQVQTRLNQYTFEFAVESKRGLQLMKLINAPKKQNSKPAIDRTLRIWYEIMTDLGDQFPKQNRITLLDDSSYVWNPKDYGVIENLCFVHKWSQKEALLRTLQKVS